MQDTATQVLTGIEAAISLSGLWLLWRVVLSADAKKYAKPAALPFWAITKEQFFMCVWIAVMTMFAAALVGGYLAPRLPFSKDLSFVVAGSAVQFGMIAGVIIANFVVLKKTAPPAPIPHKTPAILLGITVFMMVLPFVFGLTALASLLLKWAGLPTDQQDLVDLLVTSNSTSVKTTILLLAVFVAPVGEELIFRAGLFRYMNGRTPRWVALLVPSAIFAALHVTQGSLNGLVAVIPLFALAIIFSLAYERTGRISTTIIAHSLFNLNSALYIMLTPKG